MMSSCPGLFFRQLSVNLGVAEARTLKLDLVVKKWQNQKNLGILIYALCRFQNHKNPVGRIDTLTPPHFENTNSVNKTDDGQYTIEQNITTVLSYVSRRRQYVSTHFKVKVDNY